MTEEQGSYKTMDWHERRRKGIGGSDIAAVAGVSPYKTPHEVWQEKTARETPQKPTPAMKRGTLLEPLAIQEFEEADGAPIGTVDGENRYFIHPDLDICRAEVDGLILDDDKHILEVKCPNSQVYLHMKFYGIPEYYICQAQWNMMAAQADKCTFWIFCADTWEGFPVEVHRDETIMENLTKAAKDFWQYVENDTPPPQEEEQQPEPVKMPDAPQGEITVLDDDEWQEKVGNLKELADIKKQAEEMYEEAKKQVQGLMEKHGAQIAEGSGARIYWKESKRKSIDTTRLKKEQPDIAEKYTREKTIRSFRPFWPGYNNSN